MKRYAAPSWLRLRMRREPAPGSEAALLSRARALVGLNLAELAERQQVEVPAEPRRAKGFAGQLLELALGADAGSLPVPDFTALGVELKTIPLRDDGSPAESTYLCVAPLHDRSGLAWEESPVYLKLRRVLWIPVEASRGQAPGARRIGWPTLWSPSAAEDELLRNDWEEITTLIATGRLEEVDSRMGRALQLRPKAASGRTLTQVPTADGSPGWTLPRGYYLRPSFTAALLQRARTTPRED